MNISHFVIFKCFNSEFLNKKNKINSNYKKKNLMLGGNI